MQNNSLDTIPIAPYAFRNQALLRDELGLSDTDLGDFSPTGFIHIIEKLEGLSTLRAREALNAERRAYLLLWGSVEPYSPAELKSPMRRAGELELEFQAARRFK